MQNKQTAAEERAAYWAMKVMSGDLTKSEREAFDDWRREPVHQRAFDEFSDIGDKASEAYDAVAEAALERELYEFAHSDERRRKRWFAAAPLAAAAAAVVAFISISFLSAPAGPQVYVTAKGERADFTLSDGSVVSLNTDSEVSFVVEGRERRAQLIRGEAMFDVARMVERPFVVSTPTARVSVLGTRFNVRENGPGAIVSVLSGVVQVGPPIALGVEPGDPYATLIAGQQAVFSDDGEDPAVKGFNPDTVVSWRQGAAFYEQTPLREVVLDLNRYYPVPIVIADPGLADIRVTGGFDLSDQAVAVEALTVALSLRADRTDPNIVALYGYGSK